MQKRVILYADEGMVLTNGTTYGTEIYLEVGETGTDYKEISRAEYDSIKEQEATEE